MFASPKAPTTPGVDLNGIIQGPREWLRTKLQRIGISSHQCGSNCVFESVEYGEATLFSELARILIVQRM